MQICKRPTGKRRNCHDWVVDTGEELENSLKDPVDKGERGRGEVQGGERQEEWW